MHSKKPIGSVTPTLAPSISYLLCRAILTASLDRFFIS